MRGKSKSRHILFSFQFSGNLLIFRHSSLPRTSRRTSGVQLDHLGSFKQQLEYLLTSRERSQLKRALQNYATRRDAARLLEDMVLVLDTPSKRTLWLYIIPLLSTPHQNFCRIQLKIPPSVGTSGKKYLDAFEDREVKITGGSYASTSIWRLIASTQLILI